MSCIVSKYIFRKLLISFISISPIAILMVWLAMSMRFVELIITDDISFSVFFTLILSIIPDIAGTILPVCFLISSIIVLAKMQGEKELVILMTAGKSDSELFRPLLLFAILITSLCIYIQTTVSPIAHKNMATLQDQIRTSLSTSIIKQGKFNLAGSSVVYVSQKKENSISDVFIFNNGVNGITNTITAKSGIIEYSDKKLFLNLKDGNRLELDHTNAVVSSLNFKEFIYDVSEIFSRFAKFGESESNYTQQELLQKIQDTTDVRWKNIYNTEYHSRYLQPFTILINMLIIALFMFNFSKNPRRIQGAFCSFVFGIANQVILLGLLRSSIKDPIFINFAVIYIIVASLVLYARIVR